MCVRFAPIFWDFNVWKCYIPKWLIIYCSPIIHKLREPTQNGVIQFMVTKRGQISKWIWVSKPQPTIGIWLCISFRWKTQLHILHRDLSFDAILRAFFVVRKEIDKRRDGLESGFESRTFKIHILLVIGQFGRCLLRFWTQLSCQKRCFRIRGRKRKLRGRIQNLCKCSINVTLESWILILKQNPVNFV